VEVKKLFLSLVIIIGVTLLAIGLFFGNVEFTSADDKIDKIKDKDYINSLRVNDSIKVIGDLTKEYIADDKELKINDKKGLLVDLKLLTPYENKVSSSGIEPIAKWQAIDWSDKWKLFDKIDSYKINDDYKVKDKNYVLKYLVETEKTNCYDESQINNETLENETKEYCYDYIQKDWIKFKKVKDLPHKNITIGLFANSLVEGEHIEFIPTIEGFEVLEWASYLVTDLVSYYKLDETSGTTADDAHGSNDGSFSTGVTVNQTGIIEKAYSFDGTNYLTLANDPLDFAPQTDAFSISAWVKTTDTYGVIVGKDGGGTLTNQVQLAMWGGGILWSVGGTRNVISTASGVNDNKWHHIVGTSDGSSYTLYIDNVSIGSNTPGTSTTSAVSSIGSRPNGWGTSGIIDEVGIWEKELTSTEVSELWNSGDGWAYISPTVYCNFSGYAFDEDDTALVGANVTVWNQFNVSEYYSNTTIADGKWSVQVPNSTNTYMAGAYYNNTLIGQLKQGISGTC